MATRSRSTEVDAAPAATPVPGRAPRMGRHVIDLTSVDRPGPRMADYEAAFGPLSSLHQHLLPVEVGKRGMDRLRALVQSRSRA